MPDELVRLDRLFPGIIVDVLVQRAMHGVLQQLRRTHRRELIHGVPSRCRPTRPMRLRITHRQLLSLRPKPSSPSLPSPPLARPLPARAPGGSKIGPKRPPRPTNCSLLAQRWPPRDPFTHSGFPCDHTIVFSNIPVYILN